MSMVTSGYSAGAQAAELFIRQGPRKWAPTTIIQQVLIVGPDGKDYEALYTLELQPDGHVPHHRRQPAGVEFAEHVSEPHISSAR